MLSSKNAHGITLAAALIPYWFDHVGPNCLCFDCVCVPVYVHECLN